MPCDSLRIRNYRPSAAQLIDLPASVSATLVSNQRNEPYRRHASFPSGRIARFLRADLATEHLPRSAQSISVFDIGPSARISHTTGEPSRQDIRAAEVSQWPFALLLIAEVAIHQLIVNRETLPPRCVGTLRPTFVSRSRDYPGIGG